MEKVVLVDQNDKMIGSMEKMEAHEKGLLHRAFSVFVFNFQGQLLLQRRSATKYHSPGLWTNTCCSHQRIGESTEAAAHRRLIEEMGFNCPLEEQFSFQYKASFSNGLIEHELDHVLFGYYEGYILPNPTEVDEHRFVDLLSLQNEIDANPENFTEWFKICINQVYHLWPQLYCRA